MPTSPLVMLKIAFTVLLGSLALGACSSSPNEAAPSSTPASKSTPREQTETAQSDAGLPAVEVLEKAFPAQPPYSPYAGRSFPTRPLFGDTHLHTSLSLDAGAAGTRLGPDAAYRFARGEEITTSTGLRAKIGRPLDFLVVSDHAEAFGAMGEVVRGNPTLMEDPTAKGWHDKIQQGGEQAFAATWEIIKALSAGSLPKVMTDPVLVRPVWEQFLQVADQFNDPGTFTAFSGYEWTSMPDGDNMHRCVVFRDGADKTARTLPFSANDSENVEDLWKALASYEEQTGGRALAIPHNGNVSGGRMFALADFFGNPMTRAYAEARSRWEPVIEVTQQKGDSEAHPALSPSDEFAAYERWDKMNLNGLKLHQDSWFATEYAREALKNGLLLERELGVNPFKFGMIGSTDSHVGFPAVEEDNFFGKATPYEPAPGRWEHEFTKMGDVKVSAWELGAAGYAAVWATENTRASIFDAMQRREVYATTGSRPIVRFFGGYDFVEADASDRMPARIGYAKGVPMGGDLARSPAGKAPTFLAAALKDPLGANLDRIQVVKGWLDESGKTHERIFDVAVSGARTIDADGRCKTSVGSTVDVANASWTNSIGAPELIAVWKDPTFDPAQRAFYYLRVIEIPTPRWTAYDVKHFGITMSPEVPMTTTERAYTSPIWYTPSH